MKYFACEKDNALFVSLDQIHYIEGTPQNRIEGLENELRVLRAKHQQLKDNNRYQQEAHQHLQRDHSQLKEEHQQLQIVHKLLDKNHWKLLDEHQQLQIAHNFLSRNHWKLREEHQQLQAAQQKSVAFGIDPWKISHDMVKQGRLIGGGGWGAVSEGSLKVAVKQIYPNIVSKENLSRLKREMELLALVRHPNLVLFFAAVFDEKADLKTYPPLIITELLDTDLRQAYEKEMITTKDYIGIFRDTARALDYLHRRHEPIIHRDMSSANVLLKRLPDNSWVAKVSDLRSANFAGQAYTMNEGAVVYIAPEAFTNKSDTRSLQVLTTKVDVYSYGITLCEVITSTFPDKKKFPSMLASVQREWPDLHQVIDSCTAEDPKKRPTMASILSTLEKLPQQSQESYCVIA